jgi:hypothetical protein
MAFFNSKEEVYDIELTQYGKLLLSRGLLKPAYYSLHDDDVLYDSDYAGVEENTNYAEVRIQDETPVHKTFYDFKELRPIINFDLNQQLFRIQKSNHAIRKPIVAYNSLSNSTISNHYIPAWEINNLSTNFTSSSRTFTNLNVISASIPQFNVEVDTLFIKADADVLETNRSLRVLSELEETTDNLDEFTYICVNKPILFQIIEHNCDFKHDAFEYEVYKVSEEDGKEIYTQLKLSKEITNYDEQTDLYVQNSNMFLEELNQTYADYFFNISVDREIGVLDACRYILRDQDNIDLIFDDISICDDIRESIRTSGLYDGLPPDGESC